MIKQAFDYVDIDGQPTSQLVMFNLTQFEIEGEMELEVIQDRFQKFQDEVIGDDPNAPLRQMTGPEKREILSMVKILIKHSYGIKDGKRFKKSQEIWDEFEQTGAFSAFIYWLFSDPSRANAFMAGIWPQGVDRPEDQPSPDLKVVQNEKDNPNATDDDVAVDTTPSIEGPLGPWDTKDNLWDYSREELLGMGDGEFAAVMQKFSDGKNVPGPLLVVSQQRKNRE